ncbi:phosphate ABC transporter permease subunit PstC [Falsarthrobacter nasiphocae]|uniref:Phosphate transport system permease protein n=1 Tax=Falsarthrobacter nasiphocae TaxID=189863 RepID=A0AAE3YDN8_9MICC|nr:phosphate ABC transporter permease subunit PstC [Falsarthrobacter nasiphocae]MDR6891948.1 phosphate transport system permease protein [Falsarthrobacter nasiphocae]
MSSTTASTRRQPASGRAGDKVFSGLSLGAGILILIVLACVAIFLVVQAWPALIAPASASTGGAGFLAYVWPFVVGTVVASLIALLLATPIGIGVALFITHYSHRRVANALGYVIDLLAAIPSVVYGAWGIAFLAPNLKGPYEWLAENMGWIPIFAGPASQTGRTLLTASIVLAVMVLPIITSISRELFLQVPRLHEEAALALGATRWEMIRMSVLPFARPGIISGVMLGLGRALGETMAVTLVLSSGALTASLVKAGNQTIPAEIALNFPEAFGLRMNELIAAGLVLFVITLAVNLVARWIVTRHKEFSGAN